MIKKSKDTSSTDLALKGQYEKYLEIYNLKQKELSEQSESIEKEFEAYQNNLNELEELKAILKKKKRDVVEMHPNERKLHQIYRDNE